MSTTLIGSIFGSTLGTNLIYLWVNSCLARKVAYAPNKKKATASACLAHYRALQIVRDMKAEEGEWDDGTICDPKNGKIYGCKMWFEEGDPNTLKVRGYWGFIYRTQEWIRQ